MWSFPGIWDPATKNATMRKASSIILSFRNSRTITRFTRLAKLLTCARVGCAYLLVMLLSS
jgi:hypothetical protein